jgi:hypothetical protein
MQELGDVAVARIEFERWLERQPLAERRERPSDWSAPAATRAHRR